MTGVEPVKRRVELGQPLPRDRHGGMSGHGAAQLGVHKGSVGTGLDLDLMASPGAQFLRTQQ